MTKRCDNDGRLHLSRARFDVYPESKVEQKAVELGVVRRLGATGLLDGRKLDQALALAVERDAKAVAERMPGPL